MNDFKLKNRILRIQGLLEITGPIVFIAGILFANWTIIIVGGAIMLLDDFLAVAVGALNPLFPALFAVLLAMFINPWWYGVLWSIAIFQILGIPNGFRKVVKGADILNAKTRWF